MQTGLRQKQTGLRVFELRFQVKSITLEPAKREELTLMRMTTDTRYPFKRMAAEIPGPDYILRAVHPGKRVILENRGAAPGANIILLLPRE